MPIAHMPHTETSSLRMGSHARWGMYSKIISASSYVRPRIWSKITRICKRRWIVGESMQIHNLARLKHPPPCAPMLAHQLMYLARLHAIVPQVCNCFCIFLWGSSSCDGLLCCCCSHGYNPYANCNLCVPMQYVRRGQHFQRVYTMAVTPT